MKRRQRPAAGPERPQSDSEWYAGMLSAEEWAQVRQWLESPADTVQAEVAVLRVLIRRVMERVGGDDPARALPLVRQAVDSICRARRAQRVLTGDAADSLAAAFAVVLREMGEEMGIRQ